MNDFPFGACPDPRFLYMMPQIQEALACLQYGIAARKGFVVMTGEVGTGKTTLLKTVLSSFADQRISTAFVFNPRLDVLDFLEFVLTDFGIPPTAREPSPACCCSSILAYRPLPQQGIVRHRGR